MIAATQYIADSMIKREAAFGLLFRHWLRANPRHSCAFELKQTSGSSIPFSALEEHQADWLQAVKGKKGILVRTPGTNGGEADYIYLRNFPACVVIKFPDAFHIIDIDTFLMEKKRSARKSLTSTRAKELSTITVPCKRTSI